MDVFYKNIIENSPIGYAYQKIIYNEAQEAIDYEFIEVNKAFENLTGLAAETLKGKRI